MNESELKIPDLRWWRKEEMDGYWILDIGYWILLIEDTLLLPTLVVQ